MRAAVFVFVVTCAGCGIALDVDPPDPVDLGTHEMDGGHEGRDLGVTDLGSPVDAGARMDAAPNPDLGPPPADGGARDIGVIASDGGMSTEGGASDGGGIRFCMSNADCDPTVGDEFCQFVVGACGTTGVCGARPMLCSAIDMPVCGCDGVAYPNPCTANMAGVSVNFAGSCPPPSCSSGCCCGPTDCAAGEECVIPSGALGGMCHPVFPPTAGVCWTDADCAGSPCRGAVVCPCTAVGVTCGIVEMPGSCG